jgi:hypothetical protein
LQELYKIKLVSITTLNSGLCFFAISIYACIITAQIGQYLS